MIYWIKWQTRVETQKRCFLRLCALIAVGGRMAKVAKDCEPA